MAIDFFDPVNYIVCKLPVPADSSVSRGLMLTYRPEIVLEDLEIFPCPKSILKKHHFKLDIGQ